MSVETYYRCGYQVENAAPVTVFEYAKSDKEARVKAAEAAEPICKSLDTLGLNNSVVLWTARWTHTTTVKVNQRIDFLTLRESVRGRA